MKKLYFLFFTLVTLYSAYAQTFTKGNLVILSAGDGLNPLTNTGNQIILYEISPAGTFTGFLVTVPTSGVNAMGLSGTATSEGQISLSSNNSNLVFAGYKTNIPAASSISSSTSASVPRAIGLVDVNGVLNNSISTSTYFSGNNSRAAWFDGNTNFWMVGGNTGVAYLGTGTPAVVSSSPATNIRVINSFGGNMFYSTGSGSAGIYQVGTGMPTSGPIVSTVVTTATGASPYDFDIKPDFSVMYVCDDRTGSGLGGVQKWTFSAGTWNLQYTLTTTGTLNIGTRSLAVDWSSSNPIIYAITAETTANRLVRIVDNGSLATSTIQTLATAPTNIIFRGISFAPFLSQSGEKSILGFNIPSQVGVSTITGTQVNINVPNGTNLSSVMPDFVAISPFASISPSTVTAQDFSSAVTYTVTAQDLSTRIYTVSVTSLPALASNENSITGIFISGQIGFPTISGSNISILMPFGTNRAALTPNITVSAFASISGSGALTDFTNPVMYVVTAQSGLTNAYTVTVSNEAGSSENFLTFIRVDKQVGLTTFAGNNILIRLPHNTNLTLVSITGINISSLASILPNTIGTQNFSSTYSFTVTSQIGTTNIYAVNVDLLPPPIYGNSTVVGGAVVLSGNNYLQDFNSLFGGVPTEWYIGTSATSSSQGTFISTLTGFTGVWSMTGSGFRNYASPKSPLVFSSSIPEQEAFLDRGLGVRQTSGFGDPGAFLALKITSTTGLGNFTANFNLSSADITSPRVTTWIVDFGIGLTPTTFTAINTIPTVLSTGGSSFGTLNVSVPFGTALDNISDVVWIRVTPRLASTGSLNRATTIIDDFSLNFTTVAGYMPSSSNSITGFTIASQVGMTTIAGTQIMINVPFGTNLSSVSPSSVSISSFASISPGTTTAQNFGSMVTYTVTAQDLSTREYQVIVSVLPGNDITSISGFTIPSQIGITTISGNTISVMMPNGTDLSSLTPAISIFSLSGVNPASGVAQNFNSAVNYTVTSQIGTFRFYTVSVTSLVSLSDENSITGFSIPGQVGMTTISGTVIGVRMPFGTSLNPLSPTITISSAAMISPSSGAAQDFTGLVFYAVTAQSGLIRNYRVIAVNEPGSPENSITGFSLSGQLGMTTINGTNIAINVPFGFNLSTTPSNVIISPLASISPATTTAQNFGNMVNYTVTAQDLSTQVYNVTVTVLPAPPIGSITPLSVLRNSLNSMGIPTFTGLVSVSGQIYGFNSGGGTRQFQLIDPTGAITLRGNTLPVGTAEGDIVTVAGAFSGIGNSYGTFQGLLQLNSLVGVTVGSTGNPRKSPQLVSVLNESNESDFVKIIADIDPLSWNGAASFTAIMTVAGVRYQLRINNWSEFSNRSFASVFGASNGRNVTLSGLGWQFQNASLQTITGTTPLFIPSGTVSGFFEGYQLVPYRLSDLQLPPSPENSITGFTIASQVGMTTIAGTQIMINVPFGTNLSSVSPSSVSISSFASISPGTTTAQNFGSMVTYTVTAQDLSIREYQVMVTVLPGNENNSISGFTIPSQIGITTISGNTISVMMPNGTDLSSLTPAISIFSLSGVNPASGVAQNFTNGLNYTVTSQIGTQNIYNVTVTTLTVLSDENSITGFSIPGQVGMTTISGTVIGVRMPFGTSLNPLSPTITISSAAMISPSSGAAQDFTGLVFYAVTAQSGLIRNYRVIAVNEPGSPENSITGFSLAGQVGMTTISGNNISINVPFGTNVSSLTVSGVAISPLATISPATTTAQNFGSMVAYTVTAQDLSTKIYNVAVNVLPLVTVPVLDLPYIENFSTTILGTGTQFENWTRGRTDGTPIPLTNNAPFTPANNTPSSGYSGASGGFNFIIANGAVSSTNEYICSTTGFSSIGFTSLNVNYGFRRTNSFSSDGTSSGTPNFPLLEWSTDASTWNPVLGTNTLSTIAGVWSIATPTGFNLPSSTLNQPILYFRFRVTTNSTGTGNFRIDDFVITGNSNILSSSNSITGFSLLNRQAVIQGNIINVTVPTGSIITNLSATGILSSGLATVNPAFNTFRDYSVPVLFTVTSQALTTNVYTVNVAAIGAPLSGENSITGFTLTSNQVVSVIDHSNGTITVTVPGGTYLDLISPTSVSISPLATISPLTTSSRNFNSLVIYTVTAENLSTKIYTVTVVSLPVLIAEYELTAVGVNNVERFNSLTGNNLYFTGWTRLKADGTLIAPTDANHFAATGSAPSAGYPFSSGGINAVTSNGTTTGFGVFMITSGGYNTSNWKNLRVNWGFRRTGTFTTDGGSGGTPMYPTLEWSSNGTTWNVVSGYTHPASTGSWALITSTGIPLPIQAENKPNIYFRFTLTTVGVGAGNYRIDDFYLTGSAGVNTVSGENAILGFEIPGQEGETTISGINIYVNMPRGSSVNSLTPNITISGLATISPLSGASQDFSSMVNYTVTAQSEAINVYSVYVSAPPAFSSASDITSFVFNPQPDKGLNISVAGVINGNIITVNLPAGVTIAGLVPSIIRSSAASGNIPDGAAPNYQFNAATGIYSFGYTVTAEDGLSNTVYTIRLTVADIRVTSFVILPQGNLTNSISGIIAGNTITLDVPFGTEVSGLIPTIGLSAGVSISPAAGVAPNYVLLDDGVTYSAIYTLTGADGSQTLFNIKIVVSAPSSVLNALQSTWNIYPNPTKENITIENARGKTLEISNLIGVKIGEFTLTQDIQTLNVSGFPSGLYFAKLKGEKTVLRLVIE